MEASSFSHQVVNEQQTKNDQSRMLLLQELETAKFVHNNNQTVQITMSSFRVNGIPYHFHYNESVVLPNSINSINETNTMFCEEMLTTDDMYLGHLYNSEGQRATLLTWECEDADCCQVSCCARRVIIFHIAIVIVLAVALFVLLRYMAKLVCRRVQIVCHQRTKAINKEKVERLKYFGTSFVRSQQEYFNSISSLHQIPNVPAAMPIAVQAGESRPKTPLLYERLFPFLAKRRLESQISLTNSHRRPTYENNGASINQQVSDPIGSSSQRRLTINIVSPSPAADRNH